MINRILIILLFSVSLSGATAQDSASNILTFKEAVKIALENNLNLNQQKNNLFSREVQRNQSIAAFLPNLQVRGYAQHTDGQQPNPDGGELQDLSVDQVGASIETGVTIFNGFSRINTLNQASN